MRGMNDNLETLNNGAAIQALRRIKEAGETKKRFQSQKYPATRSQDGLHLTLTVTSGHVTYFGTRWTFKPAAVHGYLVSECRTSTAASGEFLHLFWTGTYWVLCQVPDRPSGRLSSGLTTRTYFYSEHLGS